MKTFTKILTLLIFAFCAVNLYAENPDFLVVDGQVISGTKTMNGATVMIMSEDGLVETVTTDEYGYFKVSLNYDKEYTLNIVKEGHKTKQILFSTKTPDQFKTHSFKFYCKVDLRKNKRSEQAQEAPVHNAGHVYFDHENQFFTHQSEYNKKNYWGLFYE